MQWITRFVAIFFGVAMGFFAFAMFALGLWFTDREYVHLLDDCVYIHNFTIGGIVVPTYVVSIALAGLGIALFTFAAIVTGYGLGSALPSDSDGSSSSPVQ